MAKIFVCDRCGSSVDVSCSLTINAAVISTDFPKDFTLNKQYDLCRKCAVEMATKFVEHDD